MATTGRWRAYTEAEQNTALVLVVDDDVGTANAIAEMIQKQGHHTRIAHSWTEALRIFGSEEIDLVVLDAVMPNVDGFKLTHMLRQRASSYIPILMLTGLSDDNSREHALALGVDDVLTKPANAFELRMRTAALLRIRRLTSALETKSKQLEDLARRDPLTGVANRRSLDERLAMELARARRYKRPFSLIMIDIDHFKKVNDVHGHGVGDQILTFFGQTITSLVRTCDLPCRYGGEEFVVLVPDTEAAQAALLAERIRATFEELSPPVSPAGAQTASAGVSGTDVLPDDASTAALLESADLALYEAKHAGRNCVRQYQGKK